MKLRREIWKWVPGFEGHYKCSNHGRVKSVTKEVFGNHGVKVRIGKILKQSKRNNYLFIKCSRKNKTTAFSVHVLTAMLFVKNSNNKPTVNHKDGNKENNYFENLEWATRSEQIVHAIKLGLFTPVTPTKKGDKLSKETRFKMSQVRKGKIMSPITRQKISSSLIEWYNANVKEK